MQQLTIGVLGHVDHGKTALVKSLTGTDTDRLEEEKRRGLSIVLGFAYLEHDQGSIDFIDAPGHEDFIRTMISGATGIDAVLLVIAADDGIKPQTREHFAIAQLLGIKQGLIVINKSDLVDSSVLAATRNEITEAMRGTFLEHAPIHVVSAKTGDGIEALTQDLISTIASKPHKASADTFYLPLDRVFTIDGIGTVGTGTLRNGAIRCEDEVQVMPSAATATVREIQVHNQKVVEASPGQRVAINLRGIKREQLQRGNVLIRPDSIQETTCLHARLQVLDDLPRLPKRNELIRLLFGTAEVLAKMRVVDSAEIEQGATVLVQFRCRETVVVSTGEYFIARTSSPAMTFGGGEILDTSEQLLQLPKDALLGHLQKLEHVDAETKIDVLSEQALLRLAEFHAANPTAVGQDLDLFRAACLEFASAENVAYLVRQLGDSGKIDIIDSSVRLTTFNRDDSVDTTDHEAIAAVERAFRDGGTVTPSLDEVLDDDPARKRAFQTLKDAGKLVAIKDHNGSKFLVFHQDTIDAIRKRLAETYPPPSHFTVSEFRVLTGSTRKYVIPMLEYLDRNRITIRQGNNRSLSRIEN
jgi:selenocysteine-specific elongation factor